MSYGLPLMGCSRSRSWSPARSWLPLPVAALVGARRSCWPSRRSGFAWWEAYPVLRDRYWDGIAADRPVAYWMWGNLAALLVCAGPLSAPVLAVARGASSDRVVAAARRRGGR